MAIVIFNPTEFKDAYPQYADFTDAQLAHFFEVACLIVDNTEASPAPYNPPSVKTRKIVLNLLVCHQAELEARGNDITGTINSVNEGSTSISFGQKPTPSNAWWFTDTQCGALAYQILSSVALGGRLYNGCFR